MSDVELLAALARMGLLAPADHPVFVRLGGGVSSDIVRVESAGAAICLKRALPRLKVAAEWRAPVERNHYEAQWLRTAASIVPDAVPRVLAEDSDAGIFAMPFLDPASYPIWKEQLRDGHICPEVAGAIGRIIASIHGQTAGDAAVAASFATDAIFHAIRLDPYLLATSARHPDCADRLSRLARVTAATKKALVHGDVSPKNILIGPRGPVLLDAECAWYGDPAFDLAFCLTHLLLKSVWRPQWTPRYLACVDAAGASYLAGVTWEGRGEIEARTSHLLPALLLARIDGKSPVEYLTSRDDRDRVRRAARALLLDPVDTLRDVRRAWESA
jgi:aminoglycoside phosphotransferase (APT) family kinase protein